MVDSGQEPSGGITPFRTTSIAPSTNGPGGNGKNINVDSNDDPGFGPYKIVHITTWTSTVGGYDFTEFMAGNTMSLSQKRLGQLELMEPIMEERGRITGRP
jgi:hypothetical protein